MAYKYSRQTDERCAKAVGRALPVSLKTSIEVCKFIKGRPVNRAKTLLKNVIRKKQAVPLTRYFEEVAHQKGMATGKFPVKACKHILQIVESAEKNAQNLGLDTTSLDLYHAAAQRGHTQMHYGRLGRRAKRTHIEIIVKEGKKVEKKAKKKVAKKAAPKPAAKAAPKPATPKPVAPKPEAPKPAASAPKPVVQATEKPVEPKQEQKVSQ